MISKIDKGNRKELAMSLDALVVRYFKSFGHAYCLFEDLKPYLDTCYNPAYIISQIEKGLSKEKSAASINLFTNLEKIRCFFSLLESDFEKLSTATFLQYKQTIAFGVDLEPKEKQFGDDFILLLAQVCIEKFTHNRSGEFYFC
jgi:hypothetical protein